MKFRTFSERIVSPCLKASTSRAMKGRIYKFAAFELNFPEGELRSSGQSVRLQDKPLLLLGTLLDHPQTLVTREQLKERMWDSGTFVDYEQGINVAVKKIRDALGDSAEEPKYIQTVAKKGYRFLLPVEVIESRLHSQPVAESKLLSRDEQVSTPPVAARTARWIFTGITLAVLLASAGWLFYAQSAGAHHATQIRSLAVLPLRNLSPDSGQDYFADGITEDLITNLAQSLPLRVISRTSVMRYKQTSEPITQIAQELGVEAIVEGAVTRSGSRVAVTVQLIDATDDRHLWAQRYDRKVGDLLGMEAEVSQEIATKVGGTLLAHESKSSAPPHVDPQVYELCLLGRYHWNKRTAADLAKSAEYYRRAIALDPEYAPAYAGLANAYALMPSYDSVESRSAYAKAEEAAHHALELDENLAEAHATLGIIYLNGQNWRQAGPELQRALDLNPNYATAHHWHSFYLFFSGRVDEALEDIERARQLDPLSPVINADEGMFLYSLRRNEQSRIRLRQAIELASDFGQPHETLALIDLEEGDSSRALKEAQDGLALDPKNPRTMGEAGYVLAKTGHDGEARRLLATLSDLARHGVGYSSFVALVDIGLGASNDAEKAIEQHGKIIGLQGFGQWHAFDELNSNPQFQKLLAQQRVQ